MNSWWNQPLQAHDFPQPPGQPRHSRDNWLRTASLHFPQHVATPNCWRKSRKVRAPWAMEAEIWRFVTA